MASVDLEGRRIAVHDGDTIASALWRAGVRIFSRSFRYRRPRGLYCLTGDCPNCLVTVDGAPAVRACCTPARDGQRITRDAGWPSADRDFLAPLARLKLFLPRIRSLWPRGEGLARRVTGIGRVPSNSSPARRISIHHHPDLLVVGGGEAGLAEALRAAREGQSVIVADEGASSGARVGKLRADIAALPNVLLLERATAIAIYEGPLVPVAAPDALHQVHPRRIVVATGAVERHPVFPGSDLPGVWLGRGAARMSATHGLPVGRAVVFAGGGAESVEHLHTLLSSGTRIVAVVVPQDLAGSVPAGLRVVAGGNVVGARGRNAVRTALVESPSGREAVRCDAIVLSLGLEPRAGLLRQAPPGVEVVAVGEVARSPDAITPRGAGFVCLCEDVTVRDLEDGWSDGFQSTQILKRYTKATTGPCQGALCHPHLRAFAAERGAGWISGPTTARPPARPVRLEEVAAGIHHLTEQRTALHQRHLDAGATMELAGPWMRPRTYGDLNAEYWAVRRGVSIMDVGTLGKYAVTGRDAAEFLERLYPCHVRDLGEGRLRYALLLNEAGYVIDDGLIGSLGAAGYYCTFTSSAADGIESWLRDWIETWKLKVHVVNHTGAFGAVNVAGPRARDLLQRLTRDAIDTASLPYSRQREITVAGIPCRALRVGFVGELSIELHHPRSQGVALWDALLEAGKDLDIRPHGLDALRLLRLEKGHILIGQDTDFDTTPAKLGLDWAVKMEKPWFVGKPALERIAGTTMTQRLVPILFEAGRAPMEGSALQAGGRHVGFLTSARFSPALERGVSLGWIRSDRGVFPVSVTADGIPGSVTTGAFYDPQGQKLRG